MFFKKLITFFSEMEDEKKLLLFLILSGLILRIVNVLLADAIDMDGISYAEIAREFLKGNIGNVLNSERLPVYPTAIALFHLFIPDIEVAGRLVSLSFGMLLVPFCFSFAKEFWGKDMAWRLAAFVSIHPYLVKYSSRVLSESLATFLFTGAIFLFYRGFTRNRGRWFLWSGIFLAFAYLTRPEYIIYFGPLSLLLLFIDRRISNIPALLVCACLLIFSFLFYLRMHTNFWIIDRKMLSWGGEEQNSFSYLSQMFSLPMLVRNLPFVALYFLEAIVLPFLALGVMGFYRAHRSYRVLVCMLISFHIIARSFVGHVTKRYSVEFIPVVLVFSAHGIETLKSWITSVRYKKLVFSFAIVVAVILLFEGITLPREGREMQKRVGLLLRGQGVAGTVIASRLPLVGFYAGTHWTNLESMLDKEDCGSLKRRMTSRWVGYLVVDTQTEAAHSFIRGCTVNLVPLFTVMSRNKQDHITVYSLLPPGHRDSGITHSKAGAIR
jgi:4-amino-4-deoxy-L-arabinose transferase-like glycosyltransferase